MINWLNPYEGLHDIWLKGNLHSHTAPASPCGRVEVSRVLELYVKAGYDFLSISDHQVHTAVTTTDHLLIIPGIEWNSRKEDQDRRTLNYTEHLGIYCLDAEKLEPTTMYTKPQQALDSVMGDDVVVILNHPNWLIPYHYSEKQLFELAPSADGIEIFNAVIDRHQGSADATMKWDRILTDKGPILGFVSDDSHFEEDIGKAHIMVNVKEKNVESLFSGIKTGQFYCSTGVEIDKIGMLDETLYCAAKEDVFIEAIGENGQVFASAYGNLRVDSGKTYSSYLRFNLYGSGKQQAWSQPFFFAG